MIKMQSETSYFFLYFFRVIKPSCDIHFSSIITLCETIPGTVVFNPVQALNLNHKWTTLQKMLHFKIVYVHKLHNKSPQYEKDLHSFDMDV